MTLALAPVRAIYAVFFLSGISGLLYQVVWVRWFGRLFGNTVHSASIVIAVFMAGLGLGGYLVGVWIDRRGNKPSTALRRYGWFEIAIAGFGIALALLLPALEPLSAYLTSYHLGADGFYQPGAVSMLLRLAIAIVVLLPVTTLMGGTLTLLVRYLVASDTSRSGWRIGVLYGFNTAGAAFGALASDFAFVPTIGLFATQGIAVTLNLLAGLIALRLARRVSDQAEGAPIDASSRPSSADGSTKTLYLTCAAIFFSGACAMGIEILWFRQLHIGLGGYRPVFSLLLTVILVGIWLGSILGGYAEQKIRRPALLYMVSQTALVVSALAALAWVRLSRSDTLMSAESYYGSWLSRLAIHWDVLGTVLALAGVPALLMGFAYPLANAQVQASAAAVGRRAGALYLANTLGAVVGSIAVGFLLLPYVGTRGAMFVLATVGACSVVALFAALRRPISRRAWLLSAGCGLVLVAGLAGWSRVSSERFTHFGIGPSENVLTVSDGLYELIVVTELPSGARRLKTNGHNMSGNDVKAQRYMRAFVHVPLLHMDEPKSALVICFGVGSTLHALSLYDSLERFEIVDLSRHVLEHASYFERTNHGVINDPRLDVFVNDGRQHLWIREPGTYDLITLEPPPLAFAGVSALYSREFYRLARSRLREGGFVSQWLPGYQMPEDSVRSIIRAFLDEFPNAIMVSGVGKELILLGARQDGPITLGPDQLIRRLAARPKVRADLAQVSMGTATEIIGSFVASTETLRRATVDSWPVTDDFPLMDYAAPPTNCWTSRFPSDAIDVTGVESWCPACFRGRSPVAAVSGLARYLTMAQSEYQSPRFLSHSSCPWLNPKPPKPL